MNKLLAVYFNKDGTETYEYETVENNRIKVKQMKKSDFEQSGKSLFQLKVKDNKPKK